MRFNHYLFMFMLMILVFLCFGCAQSNTVDFELDMVFVEGGEFVMGCTSEQGEDCEDDEKPVHRVSISSFEIGKTAVTQRQWQAVMGSNSSSFKGGDLPVDSACWGGAKCLKENSIEEFIRVLNKKTRRKYRLPTEAEWEYAARGGNKSKEYKYSGSNTIDEVAWHNDNSDRETHAVCTNKPNELGLCDMSGNVWEWVQDWYGVYSSGFQTNPKGPKSGLYRVLRGGSWYSNDAKMMRVSDRFYYELWPRYFFFGFRLARSL